MLEVFEERERERLLVCCEVYLLEFVKCTNFEAQVKAKKMGKIRKKGDGQNL